MAGIARRSFPRGAEPAAPAAWGALEAQVVLEELAVPAVLVAPAAWGALAEQAALEV